MVSKPKVANAPGLELILKADGTFYPLWRASREAAREGYFPKSMRLDFDVHDPETHDGIRHTCQREQAAVEQWFADRVRAPAVAETLKGLSRLYQTHEASSFQKVKFNTRKTYVYELRMIESSIGDRRLERITASDFVRWHREAMESVEGGGVRKAQSLLKRLRAIISFGIVAEIDACHRLVRILDQMRFETPSRRRVVMTYDMAVAIIAKAHEMGRPSIALAQAIQFETGLRQADVVGLWAPRAKKEKARFSTGLLKWDSGLCWEDIGDDLVLVLDTSKTGSTVTHDLAAMPLVVAELERIPRDQWAGPMIINETTQMPFLPMIFSQNWRRIADAAGIPAEIWNRDSRAGSITEGDEAGATLNQLQRVAGHSNAKMTGRYVRGANVETSRAVAELRHAKRQKAAEPEPHKEMADDQ